MIFIHNKAVALMFTVVVAVAVGAALSFAFSLFAGKVRGRATL